MKLIDAHRTENAEKTADEDFLERMDFSFHPALRNKKREKQRKDSGENIGSAVDQS